MARNYIDLRQYQKQREILDQMQKVYVSKVELTLAKNESYLASGTDITAEEQKVLELDIIASALDEWECPQICFCAAQMYVQLRECLLKRQQKWEFPSQTSFP